MVGLESGDSCLTLATSAVVLGLDAPFLYGYCFSGEVDAYFVFGARVLAAATAFVVVFLPLYVESALAVLVSSTAALASGLAALVPDLAVVFFTGDTFAAAAGDAAFATFADYVATTFLGCFFAVDYYACC